MAETCVCEAGDRVRDGDRVERVLERERGERESERDRDRRRDRDLCGGAAVPRGTGEADRLACRLSLERDRAPGERERLAHELLVE